MRWMSWWNQKKQLRLNIEEGKMYACPSQHLARWTLKISLSLLVMLCSGCMSTPTDITEEVYRSRIVVCGECGGNGKVQYGEEHPIVQLGFDPGEYQCPMCGGSGKLLDGK